MYHSSPVAYKSSKANRGYLTFGREQASLSVDPSKIAAEREVANDQKETFEIGNDLDAVYPEHWPDENEIPGFREAGLAQLRLLLEKTTNGE